MAREERLPISIVLPLRNRTELAKLLAEIYDPSSPEYRHFLTVKEFTERFGPSAEDYRQVVEFARTNGFQVTDSPGNRMIVPIIGTVDQVQRAFNVSMNLYRHPTENRTFFSPDREPSVPANLSIVHLAGLNNFSMPKPLVKRAAMAKATRGSVQGSGPSGQYLGSDMRAAYYGGTTLTGRGQTIGLLQFDGYDISDVIHAFAGAATASSLGTDSVVNYTPPNSQTTYAIPIHNVLLDGATGAPGQFYSPADDGEQVLDIVQSIGMAPGLSQVRVYIGTNDVDMLNAMAAEGLANEVSISWAWTPDDPSAVDQLFEEMAAQGQSVFAASGDYGAYSPSVPYYFPAEDAWVTAVGGTTLTTDGPAGSLTAETAWNQSGGGISPDAIAIPGWQAGVGTASNGASSMLRNVPDVAMEADFDNFNCSLGSCSGGWAGTSFASPRWAGFIALVNEQAASAGDAAVGFINPWIYGEGPSPSYGSLFHDIDAGQNEYEPGYGFHAVSGYDLVTGWGSPAGQNLIDGLAPHPTTGFELSTTLSSLTIYPGSSSTTTIGVNYLGNFSGSVSLAVTSALPSGMTATFDTNPTTGSSTLTIAASIFAASQSYVVTITGSSGAVQSTTYVTVNTPSNAVVIVSPMVPAVPVTAVTFKPSVSVAVIGTIVGHPQAIHLEWAPGINPVSGWSEQNITLNQSSTPPFANATVGTWDTSSIAAAGYYTIQLSADYAEGTVSATTFVYLEPDLISENWPRWLDVTPDTFSGIAPVDFGNGDTGLALVEPQYLNTSIQPRYRIFSSDGASEQSTNLYFGTYLSPSFGSLLPGKEGESIVADGNLIYAIDKGGAKSMLPLVPGAAVEFQLSQVTLADLKGDSSLATVAYGIQNWNQLAFIYAWDSNQQLLNANFPIQVPYQNTSALFDHNQGVIVGDIDGDGKQEIVALESFSESTFTLGLFANEGTPVAWAAPTFAGTPYQMILADLDGNGKLETVIAVLPAGGSIWALHVLNPNGTERDGWPIELDHAPPFLAAGDLTRTGRLQIVAASFDKLFVLNGDGTPLSAAWPLETNAYSPFGAPVVADVDGDGYPEIVVANGNFSFPEAGGRVSTVPASYSRSSQSVVTSARVETDAPQSAYFDPVLQAFHRDGTVVRSWHIPGMHGEQPFYMPRLAVGDFNHDGMTDVAVVDGLISGGTTSGFINEGMIEVLSMGAPFNPAANDWPMLYHDAHNSARAYPVRPKPTPAAAPAFNPPQGTYTSVETIAISDATPGATIYFTTDGTTPSPSSTAYSGPITVSTSETVEAVALAGGFTQSSVAAATYTIAVPPPAFPTPTVDGLSPAYVSAGSGARTLTVSGSGFITDSVAYWGTTPLPTHWVSETQLSAQVPASDLAIAGINIISVHTPGPGGGTSNNFQFEIDTAGSGTSATPGFSSTTANVAAGSTASYPVTLSSSVTAVSVTCLNLPPGATCSYSSTSGALMVTTASTTPAGTYQVTVVFSETLPGTGSALVILPLLLLPTIFLRKRLAKRLGWTTCMGAVLLACAAMSIACGGSSTAAVTPPLNPVHQVTRSGMISLTIH